MLNNRFSDKAYHHATDAKFRHNHLDAFLRCEVFGNTVSIAENVKNQTFADGDV